MEILKKAFMIGINTNRLRGRYIPLRVLDISFPQTHIVTKGDKRKVQHCLHCVHRLHRRGGRSYKSQNTRTLMHIHTCSTSSRCNLVKVNEQCCQHTCITAFAITRSKHTKGICVYTYDVFSTYVWV